MKKRALAVMLAGVMVLGAQTGVWAASDTSDQKEGELTLLMTNSWIDESGASSEEFLKVIDSCEGKVELITDDGDRLNLKSKLCQLVSLSTIFSSSAQIPEMEIVAHELEDSKKIMDFLMRGPM